MKKLYIAVVVVLLVCFGVSAFYLADYFLESKKQTDRLSELSSLVDRSPQAAPAQQPEAGTAPVEIQPEAEQDFSGMIGTVLPTYQKVHEMNPDMIGWIRIEGTKIDYPVMQSGFDDPDFYLYRNFDKEKSTHGSIYMRPGCDFLAPSDNITLYGHNMKDGSMFAVLGEYYSKSFWEDNSLIFFDTIFGYHVYKIFAVFKTSAVPGEGFEYHMMEDAASAEEFNDFIDTCKSLSFYDTGITPVYGDKVICLSTCEYTLDDGRFVVAAVRLT